MDDVFVVYLTDNLTTGIEIGQNLSIIGTPVMDMDSGNLALEVSLSRVILINHACIHLC